MAFLRAEVQQVTGMQIECMAIMLESDVSFDAPYGYFAGYVVRWNPLSLWNHEPD